MFGGSIIFHYASPFSKDTHICIYFYYHCIRYVFSAVLVTSCLKSTSVVTKPGCFISAWTCCSGASTKYKPYILSSTIPGLFPHLRMLILPTEFLFNQHLSILLAIQLPIEISCPVYFFLDAPSPLLLDPDPGRGHWPRERGTDPGRGTSCCSTLFTVKAVDRSSWFIHFSAV